MLAKQAMPVYNIFQVMEVVRWIIKTSSVLGVNIIIITL